MSRTIDTTSAALATALWGACNIADVVPDEARIAKVGESFRWLYPAADGFVTGTNPHTGATIKGFPVRALTGDEPVSIIITTAPNGSEIVSELRGESWVTDRLSDGHRRMMQAVSVLDQQAAA
jgi:hypothetical protein